MKKRLIRLYESLYEYGRRKRIDLRYRFSVMSMEETTEYIKRTGCSIARFGDGEFGLINGARKPSFQDENEELAMRLCEVCKCEDPRLLVCVPHSFKTTKDCNEFARRFWDWWIWDNDNLRKVADILQLSPWRTRVFGDAQITRPYMDWKDKSLAGERFQRLISLWEDRDVVVIEGEQTRLGVGNDLLNRARSVRRILCPAVNAFNKYHEILSAARRFDKDSLFLLALGPTATVLAYDLAMDGYQALDIGHIDIEYEWYLQGAESKVSIAGKFTQEAHETNTAEINDPGYMAQIIERIE